MTEKDLRLLAEKLWHNKIELLAHLEKAQIEFKTLKEGADTRFNMMLR